MENTTEKVEKKEVKPRNVRRAENAKKAVLDKLVLRFFELRSASDNPDGEEVATLYDAFRSDWIRECKKYNGLRKPIKLRYEAFAESVEYYIKMEEKQVKQTAEANKVKDFNHWFRRSKVWRTRPLTSLFFWIKSLGDKEKQLTLWKTYYASLQTK